MASPPEESPCETLEEFRSLFESAGFRLVGETPTASGFSVIEATPA